MSEAGISVMGFTWGGVPLESVGVPCWCLEVVVEELAGEDGLETGACTLAMWAWTRSDLSSWGCSLVRPR